MIVRRATLADAAGIAAVHLASWRVAYRDDAPPGWLDAQTLAGRTAAWEGHLEGGELALVVVDGASIVGFCGLATPSRDADAAPGTAEITTLYVDPAHWRAGAGRALMAAALGELAGWERVTLWVLETNARAIAFYAACGFADDGGRLVQADWPTQVRMGRRSANMSGVTDAPPPAARSALGDLTILDFSRVLAGPFATMMLADLGATVIKVERPGAGDETRGWGPPHDAHGTATYFQAVNRNKTSVALDLTDEGDRARALELAASADVIVENFRPGVMDSLGLSYEALAPQDPRLVYCSITGFGAGPAGARLPGYDLLVQALGGLMSVTGAGDGEPQKVGVALVDVLTGLYASTGILAALRHRDATGEGQRVSVDLFSCLLASLVNQGSAFTVAGVVPRRMGNAHPSISPYELYPTGDGELVLAVGNDRQFAALCEVIGAPQLAADPRFATNSDRVAHRDALTTALVTALAARSAAEWAAALTDARVPAGVVNDVAGAFALAQRIGLEPIVEVPDPITGDSVPLTRNPIGLSATPASYRSAPPPLDG